MTKISGYSTPLLFKIDEIRGGSPYGATTLAGDGTRQPSETELEIARHQGRYFANFTKTLIAGKRALSQ